MKNLDFLNSAATQAQIIENAAAATSSNKSVAKKAEKTFLNSTIVRSDKLTDTARIDFCLITALVMCDFTVTSQQIVALAAAVSLDSKRLQSAAQIAKHCKDNEICTVENSVLSIEDERMQDFYTRSFYSAAHMNQLQKHAADLFEICLNYAADTAHIENAHEQAIVMHSEYKAQQKKAAPRKTRAKKAAAK